LHLLYFAIRNYIFILQKAFLKLISKNYFFRSLFAEDVCLQFNDHCNLFIFYKPSLIPKIARSYSENCSSITLAAIAADNTIFFRRTIFFIPTKTEDKNVKRILNHKDAYRFYFL